MLTVKLLEMKLQIESNVTQLRDSLQNLMDFRPEVESAIIEYSNLDVEMAVAN